jgi:hypothetical protein
LFYQIVATGAEEEMMKHLDFWHNVGLTASLVVFVGGCAANMAAPIAVEEPATSPERAQPLFDAARTAEAAKPSASASKGDPGIVVHIDPTTGEFLPEPPADGVTPPRAADAAKAPVPQFQEVSSPIPGGGVMIDLQGQFQTPLVATIDADGKVTVKHESTLPAGAENK